MRAPHPLPPFVLQDALGRASSTSGSLPPTPAQPHPLGAALTRSSSLPPLPRAAGSPAPGDAHASRPNSRAGAAAPVAVVKEEQGPTTPPYEEAGGSDGGATEKLPSLAGLEAPLPSPLGAAGAQEQGQGGSAAGHSTDSRPSSPSRGSDGGREQMSRRGSAEHNVQLPAPAKTFDKEGVLRWVWLGRRLAWAGCVLGMLEFPFWLLLAALEMGIKLL